MKFRLLIALALAVLGCSRPTPFSPLPPGPSAPSPLAGRVLHEGVVYEVLPRGDPRPVPNLRLLLWDPLQNSRVGAARRGDTTTDAAGRFNFLSNDNLAFVEAAPDSPVKFVCPSHPLWGSTDLYVVDASWSGAPPDKTLQGFGSVRGRVIEHRDDQPVAGVTVALDGGNHMPPSVTNADGFYAICSPMGADLLVSITARKEGYVPVTIPILWGWDYFADFRLVRR